MTDTPKIPEDWTNPYVLARMADVATPDAADSPGAVRLLMVAQDVFDQHEEGYWDEDSPYEIADSIVPVYTFERWQTFVDLAAWDEDLDDIGGTPDDMTEAAGIALYMIFERLAQALAEDWDQLGEVAELDALDAEEEAD